MQMKKVSDGLYRSNKPSVVDFNELCGYRIINLQVLDGWEPGIANHLECEYFHFPTSAIFPPSSRKIDTILDLMKFSTKPVLVHCQFGADRTGLIVGLYRVLKQGWSREDAYKEMIDNNFHPVLIGLKWYFYHRTKGLK